MTVQHVLVALVAMVALAYLGRKLWTSLVAKGCGGGCGCAAKPKEPEKTGLIPVGDLTARLREESTRN